MDMKLYQPVLFVGLGGTGCNIGVEFERRLRDAICGPDGRAFTAQRGKGAMAPYQLPNCVQVVYADMNQAELRRLPARVVPGPEHEKAVPFTAQYVTGLVPDLDSYPELAMHLRLRASDVVRGWLPPATKDEPPITPLQKGAGQFPTIGRAALYGAFLNGTAPATREIEEAVGRLARAGADLQAMGGQRLQGIDVFVALSMVGGTGAGIFYDYLHLIAHTVRRAAPSLRVQIYPLVLMPSAFEDGLGGGRKAELNAARGLLDLFRLVDAQNRAQARTKLHGSFDLPASSEDDVAVTYPGGERIVINAGRIQTGFLFNRPAGATKEDLYASVVSLVMSLIATEMTQQERQTADQPVSFAESFVNEAADRAVPASNGIGSRGVSTASVATLSVPVDELAGIVGARLLREAIIEMAAPVPEVESNNDHITNFLVKANVYPAVQQRAAAHAEPGQEQGARNVTAALHDRRKAMQVGIESLKAELDHEVPLLATRFAPREGLTELLGTLDPFRAQRVIFGHDRLSNPVDQKGASGTLERRRTAPSAPAGIGIAPPEPPALHDRMFRPVRWNDDQVVAARNQQQQWYEWQTRSAWAAAWNKHVRQWQPSLRLVQGELAALTDALAAFARQDDFTTRSDELYRKRVGVTYLLPASGAMTQFYATVLRELPTRLAETGHVDVGSPKADLLRELIGENAWGAAFHMSLDESPGRAVSYLLEQVTVAIEKFLRDEPPGGQPIVPKLHDLLAQAATGRPTAGRAAIDEDYVREFRGELAGMLPAHFSPQGNQPLKALISYPAGAANETIEAYLEAAINLPQGRVTTDYRPTATESITVVLYRTSMGITEVDEVRDVLRRWAGALDRPEPTDLPRWRQRIGYDFGYLATREVHRVEILHRLLCALWNGRASVENDPESPDRIDVTLEGDVTMTLPLTPLRDASSWGSLLPAYELWALDDNQLHRAFCERLMQTVPDGITNKPVPPAELYRKFREITAREITELEKLLEKQSGEQQSRTVQMLSFWKATLPAALDRNFTGVSAPVERNLHELEQAAGIQAIGSEAEGSEAE
jgi:hypothetical protein